MKKGRLEFQSALLYASGFFFSRSLLPTHQRVDQAERGADHAHDIGCKHHSRHVEILSY
jgi:hypothetical protein